MIDGLSGLRAVGANGPRTCYAVAKRRGFIVVQAIYNLGNTKGFKKYGPTEGKHPHCDKGHKVAQRRVANNRTLVCKVLDCKRHMEEQRRDKIVEYAIYKPHIIVSSSTTS